MAHFAKINDQGIVEQVIVVNNDDILTKTGKESEKVGQAFIKSIGLEGKWRQTSYNGNFRGKYAGIGDFFDEGLGIDGEFVSPTTNSVNE